MDQIKQLIADKPKHFSIIEETKTDSNTEWAAAQLAGYDRIWDCGKKKWAITL